MDIVALKRKITTMVWTLLFLIVVQTMGVAQGITFSKSDNWKEVVDQARSEGKFIFVDCYTTWCHPCRLMAAQVFADDSVGSFMRDKFISVKLQMDSTKTDSDFVKSWYVDAKHIGSTYEVRSYPTLLYFDSDGQIVHKSVGAVPIPEFLRISSSALVPQGQYYTLLQQLSQGDRSRETYIHAFTAALGANEAGRADSLFRTFWSLCDQTDRRSSQVLSHAAKFVQSTSDSVFTDLLEGVEDNVAGADVKRVVKKLIADEVTTFLTRDVEKPDFGEIDKLIQRKYPAFAQEALVKSKLAYHQDRSEWRQFVKIVDAENSREESSLAFDELMNYAYMVFYHCGDKKSLKTAESWLSTTDSRDALSAAVIQSLLQYRQGERAAAITLMGSTISKLSTAGGEQPELQQMLSRMTKGEMLWSPE
ncbi:Thioredoxin-like domain-containing protein [Sphingobacterium nematocida]|uniref:Thioredoxin-like domain-containing protein n=1 Tax=Sphingobacterium nematocida TaxID=1513896 RepID=A0A1T5BQ20_9SPHI|nr:thioredoxin fold domain-containing protein [Sphingobacterium nematocida]SKB49432.1 Thioredoxin-like domain-containing protein [Sphingobacterium nematocida]